MLMLNKRYITIFMIALSLSAPAFAAGNALVLLSGDKAAGESAIARVVKNPELAPYARKFLKLTLNVSDKEFNELTESRDFGGLRQLFQEAVSSARGNKEVMAYVDSFLVDRKAPKSDIDASDLSKNGLAGDEAGSKGDVGAIFDKSEGGGKSLFNSPAKKSPSATVGSRPAGERSSVPSEYAQLATETAALAKQDKLDKTIASSFLKALRKQSQLSYRLLGERAGACLHMERGSVQRFMESIAAASEATTAKAAALRFAGKLKAELNELGPKEKISMKDAENRGCKLAGNPCKLPGPEMGAALCALAAE